MYNFDRELNKIKLAVMSKKLTEDQAKYEVRKLHALAKKFQVPWEADVFVSSDPVLVETVQNDVRELYQLHQQGKINDKHFLRDNAKILALCEEFNFPFPGSKVVADGLTVDFVAVIAEEIEQPEDEYAGLEFDDVFDDEEAESEPQHEYTYDFGDVTVEIWIEASEYVLKVQTPAGEIDSYNERIFTVLGELTPQILEKCQQQLQQLQQVPHASGNINVLKEIMEVLADPERTVEQRGEYVYEILTDGWLAQV